MAKYKVLEKSFIGNTLVEAGAIVDVEFHNGGKPGWNLEPVQDGAVSAGGSAPSAEDAEAARVRRVAAMDALIDANAPATPSAATLV